MRFGLKRVRSVHGFTLIELLAVIAIIGILAAIVVPQVSRYIYRARVTRAVSEIKNMDTAMRGMLTDTGRASFRDFLSEAGRTKLQAATDLISAGNYAGVQQAADFYRDFFYELLRQGKDSQFARDFIDAEVRQKLGTSYMEIGNDPWGQQYRFWMGPLRGPMALRSYRTVIGTWDASSPEPDDPAFSSADAYIYNADAETYAKGQIPGQPRNDEQTVRDQYQTMHPQIQAYGFPATRDLPVYIWSMGPNQKNDANLLVQMYEGTDQADPAFLGGGDDPNNWDNEAGWDSAPKS